MAVDDGCECCRQVGLRLDVIEFTGLDQRGDDAPVFTAGVVASEESVFSVQCNRSDCPLDGVAVHLDAAIVEEEAEAIPVFGDVFQGRPSGDLAERRAR